MTTKDLIRPIANALVNDEIFRKALFERPKSISHLLPYDEFIADGSVFRNKDGSLGVIFEASLIEHEPLTSTQMIETVDSLKAWLSLPENCTLQVLYDQAPVSPLDNRFNAFRKRFPKSHPVSTRLYEERILRIEDNCRMNSAGAPLARRTFLSIRYFPQERLRPVQETIMAKPEATLFNTMKEYSKELTRFRHLVKNFEASSKIALRRLDAEETLDILRRFFNPASYYTRTFAKFAEHTSISEQVIYNSPVLDHRGIEREGQRTRTLSLKTSPQYAYPGGMAYFTRLDFPFKLALNFSFPSKAKMKKFFDIKEFFLQNTPSARARRQREEVLESPGTARAR